VSPMRWLPLVVVVLLALPASAQYPDPQRAPHLQDSPCYATYDKHFVYDFLGVLDPDLAFEMEGAACDVYKQTSAHVVLVTVNDTAGETLENYAFHLFERWGIGDAQRHDGLLLLYVGDTSSVRIEVGYGLEGVVNSHVAQQAIGQMADAKQRALDAGEAPRDAVSYALGTGSLFLLTTLMDSYRDGAFPKPQPAGPPWWFWFAVFIVILLVLGALARSSRRSGGWGYGTSPYWAGAGAGWASSHWSGGGSFGGGLSGGGGGSGRI
jgi:uncharacterized protein